MEPVRIALAQLNLTVGDLDGNRRRIERAIEEAGRLGAGVLAAPELAVTGYPPEDLVLRPAFVRDNLAVLREIARAAMGLAAVVGFVDREGDRLYNAAALLSEGRVQAVYHKHVLPNYGVFDEKRYFEPGEGIVLARLGEIEVGITICEDVWSAAGPHVACAAAGASIVVNINGSPYHRGKGGQRRELLSSRARESRIALAYVNMVGGQDELVFDGQSCAFDEDGRLLARAAQFEEELLVFDIAPQRREAARPPGDASGEPVRRVSLASGAPPESPPGPGARTSRPPLEPRLSREMDPLEETYHALVLGVRDYLGKNGFEKAVIGLSGGIDSSLTAAIAADALGPRNVLGVLAPSEFTSPESLRLAEELAAPLGISTITLPIHDLFEGFLKVLDPVFEGTGWGIAEENLQARIRGSLLMAISNKTGRIVLSTGNKSEMATGYATLYGDMAGGFAVLKDVPKTLVYRLARWRNRARAVIPAGVLTRPPTAELRAGQLDAETLPPYELLDRVLEAYVEEDRSVEEIVEAGHDRELVRRVAEMVDRAEYKRRQAPPGIKITPRAFGKDRRPPITNRYRPRPGPGD
jgi:NAD+ synthase (glutamine-hydrolysing)